MSNPYGSNPYENNPVGGDQGLNQGGFGEQNANQYGAAPMGHPEGNPDMIPNSAYGESPYHAQGSMDANNPYGANAYGQSAYPQQGYGMTADNQLDFGESIGQGWKRFAKNAWPWILSALVFMLGVMVITFVGMMPLILGSINAPLDAYGNSTYEPSASDIIPMIVLFIPLLVISVIYSLNCSRNALREVNGEKVSFGSFYSFKGLGTPFVVSLVVGLIEFVGMVLLVIPGIIAAILLSFAVYACFEENLGVGDSLKRSVELVKKNLGPVILLLIVLYLINAAGGLVYIGALVTLPLSTIAMGFAYKRMAGRNPQVLP